MQNIKHIILISSIAAFIGSLSCQADDHCYPTARIKTVSGKEVTLTNVSVYVDGEKIHYYATMHQELTDITYTDRTGLGSDFEGKNEFVTLYQPQKLVYFKKIVFSGGDPQIISFENHADISSKEVVFTFPGDPQWSSDQWLFFGTAIDQGKQDDVKIRGSKIETITFEGVPVLIQQPMRK